MSKNKTSQAENTLAFIMFGAFKSGRSTFIATISDVYHPVFWNKEQEENYFKESEYKDIGGVFINYGKVIFDEIMIGLFSGIHGSTYLGVARDTLSQICYPVFLDSSAPETFHIIRKIINDYLAEYDPAPMIIVANKQDLPDAWSIADLRIALKIPNEIQIVLCIAHDKKSAVNVLIIMLEEALKALD